MSFFSLILHHTDYPFELPRAVYILFALCLLHFAYIFACLIFSEDTRFPLQTTSYLLFLTTEEAKIGSNINVTN